MAKIVYQHSNFNVVKTRRDYVIINTDGCYKNHAHFDDLEGAKNLLCLIAEDKKPKGRYFVKACIRLIGKESYDKMSENKKKPRFRKVNRRK